MYQPVIHVSGERVTREAVGQWNERAYGRKPSITFLRRFARFLRRRMESQFL